MRSRIAIKNRLLNFLAVAKHFPEQVSDIHLQIELLLPANFIVKTPLEKILCLPRYMEAIHYRLDRLGGNLARDSEYCEKLSTYQQKLQQLLYQYPEALIFDGQLYEARWLLEELRVALFAQHLKTNVPASFKRLELCWETVDFHQYALA